MTPERPILSERKEAASLVAVEVLVLWSSDPADAGVWPLLVLVVDEEADAAGAAWLVDHLDDDRLGDFVVKGHCQWTVTADGEAVLALSVRAVDPVALDLTVLVPAECFLGFRHPRARGDGRAYHAASPRGRTPARRSTTPCCWAAEPPAKVTEIADLLCANGSGHP